MAYPTPFFAAAMTPGFPTEPHGNDKAPLFHPTLRPCCWYASKRPGHNLEAYFRAICSSAYRPGPFSVNYRLSQRTHLTCPQIGAYKYPPPIAYRPVNDFVHSSTTHISMLRDLCITQPTMTASGKTDARDYTQLYSHHKAVISDSYSLNICHAYEHKAHLIILRCQTTEHSFSHLKSFNKKLFF